MLYKKILLPTDGSPASIKAALYVAAILKEKPDIKVTALSVDRMAHRIAAYETPYNPDMATAVNDMASQRLASTAEVFRKEGFEIETVRLQGEPGPAICKYAAENGFDHIVMGTTGAGHFSGLLFGSVALKVIGMSKLPVVLIGRSN